MTLIVKLYCNNTLKFLIIYIIFGILSKNFADDQRSATVSKNAPNATTNAFSDLPQKTQNWTRYLSVSTGDDSVFKQVGAVGNDASSSWVLIDGYELRQLPYSFPQDNRPGYIHYRGTNIPDAECKQYQPQFSGTAGFIGGSGTQNNDYAWTVSTNDFHTIFRVILHIGGSDGKLEEKSYTINVYPKRKDIRKTLLEAETGHSGWIAECEPNPAGQNLMSQYGAIINKKVGLWYRVDQIFTIFHKLKTFLYTNNHEELNWPGIFNLNDGFYEGDKKTYLIVGTKSISLLEYTKGCMNKVIYNMENQNCTDLAVGAMEAAGLTPPLCRHEVLFIMTENGQYYERAVNMCLPELLFKGL